MFEGDDYIDASFSDGKLQDVIIINELINPEGRIVVG